MIPPEVTTWIAENGYGEILSRQRVGGGCINDGMTFKTSSGQSFFLKVNGAAPADMFAREAEGLEALQQRGSPVVPRPYIGGIDFLLMEDLSPAPRRGDYWQAFGSQLAALHHHTFPRFGFANHNYIGSTPQPNHWTEDGYEFFAERRLLFMARIARERGLLDAAEFQNILELIARLPDLVPPQPPSLIHGDLWSGNAITDSQGAPAIIDPAAHYGWAEAELAMTTLFGTFPGVFYKAYEEARPLEPGYQARFPIYNLYHLLNHVVLFGRGYLGQVKAVLRRFV